MNVANKLLKMQYLQQNGLQHTLVLVEEMEWNSTATNFIQIINVGWQHHWVCLVGYPLEFSPWPSIVSFPDPPRKAERGSGALSDNSCHMGRGRTS